MRINEEQLREFIEDSGIISKAHFEKALKRSEEENLSIGDILIFFNFYFCFLKL